MARLTAAQKKAAEEAAPPAAPPTPLPVGLEETETTTIVRRTAPIKEPTPAPIMEDDAPDDHKPILMDDDDGEFLEPPLSALDELLSQLEDATEVTVYVRRLQDPPNYQFRTPCPQATSMGPLEWDSSYRSRPALEAAVQQAYGGGKYQLQIFYNGKPKRSFQTIVADPPVRSRIDAGPVNGSSVTPAPLTAAPTFLGQVKELGEIFTILNPTRREPPAPDPAETIQGQFGMLREVMATVKEFMPEPVAAPAIEVKTGNGILDTIASAASSFLSTPMGSQAAGNLLNGITMKFLQPPAPGGGNPQPAPQQMNPPPMVQPQPAQPTEAELAAARPAMIEQARVQLIGILIQALRRGRNPGWVSETVEDIVRVVPELRDRVLALFSAPAEQIMSFLSTEAQDELSAYPGAAAWLDQTIEMVLDSPTFADAGEDADGGDGVPPVAAEPQFHMQVEEAEAAGVGSQVSGVGEAVGALEESYSGEGK